ncbi:uncharacterized protein Eint_110080 [Encephalitozoon intestinalis ATCC 50506]|uniref:Ubiquitin-like domain-containing protein n=1 Tax=Encephalitozoon intestinalis (strain ATCC 50506) TaxID=876142 RepID=E0SA85_ENCIT|nr:uncharacterized protein Eint_110080 [Encephalitozoon intestinalis ATCC 50506]ADM12510.1 hypothetical protein Eint_110080 [Encephalitozoon intestinalis ATCC 50506]UTX46362.1 hypothetical protein GPK93_11g19670 [Encephalitozoon intestinalis]
MIVKAVNHDDLYVDGQFQNLEDLKSKIYQRYGIPINSQHIIFNGKFYVLGIFNAPLETSSDTYSNPLGYFGLPDSLFNNLASDGITPSEIRAFAFPHKEDLNDEESPSLSEVLDIKTVAKRILEVQYNEIHGISESLNEEEKAAIVKNPGEYVELVLKHTGGLPFL